MTPVDRSVLDRLRELADAATPGPWAYWGISNEAHDDGLSAFTEVGGPVNGGMKECQVAICQPIGRPHERIIADAEFIAAANPATVLGLLELIGELAAGLREIAEADYIQTGKRLASTTLTPQPLWDDVKRVYALDDAQAAARVLLDRLETT